MSEEIKPRSINVLGTPLKACCNRLKTGFFRTGSCETNDEDHGLHTVCTRVNEEFLEYSRLSGNDLSTPRPEYGFAGLQPGDCWCVCALRWKQAFDAGYAAPINLEATEESTLEYIPLSDLMKSAIPEQRN